jgi:hypothetical protein
MAPMMIRNVLLFLLGAAIVVLAIMLIRTA